MARSRPESFKLGVFDWTIKYLDFECDDFGETYLSTKEIHIFLRKCINEQVLKDTLLHECMHAVLEDVVETTSKMSESKPEDVEEQIVRLVTPRLHELFTNNPELRDYIFTKSVDKSKKK